MLLLAVICVVAVSCEGVDVGEGFDLCFFVVCGCFLGAVDEGLAVWLGSGGAGGEG